MQFVFPAFFWALAALAIPVLIHLFNFRRTVRIYFSNVALLEQIEKKEGQRRTLKRYLILLSRLLFVFFLVVAFAQPYWPASEQSLRAERIVFYLDNSLSMTTATPTRDRALDMGIRFVEQTVEALPVNSRYKLLTNDFSPFSDAFVSAEKIRDQLTQVRPSAVTRTAEEIMRRIGSDSAHAEVFWISDFQRSTFAAVESASLQKTRWRPIPIPLAEQNNVYIDSVWLENPFLATGEKTRLGVSLAGSPPVDQPPIAVKLLVDNKQYGTASAEMKGRRSTQVYFAMTETRSGMKSARIHLDEARARFDNDFYVTLNFADAINVVEIRGDSDNASIERVFGNKKIFSYIGLSAVNIDYSALKQAHLIVLNGVATINPTLREALKEAVASRRCALLLIPAEHADVASYSKLPQLGQLEKGTYRPPVSLDELDLSAPFFNRIFEAQRGRMQMPYAAQTIRWGSDRDALLKRKDAHPFLSRKGNIFLLAAPLKKKYTNFDAHALFVPVMYKMATATQRHERVMYHTLAEKWITVKVNPAKGDDVARLVGKREVIPAQHRVGENVLIEIPKADLVPGVYAAVYQNDTVQRISLNIDKRESKLAQYSPEEVYAFYGTSNSASMADALASKTFTKAIKERYLGTPLWQVALMFALLFLLAEVLCIRYLT